MELVEQAKVSKFEPSVFANTNTPKKEGNKRVVKFIELWLYFLTN